MSSQEKEKPVTSDVNDGKSGKSLCERLKNYITVEPVVICYMFGIIIHTGLLHFEFEKACVANLKIDPNICALFDELEKHGINCNNNSSLSALAGNQSAYQFHTFVCDAYERSQEEIVSLNSYRYIVTGLIQVVVLLFAGSWSDRVGLRKPCILIPMVADIFHFGFLIVAAYFMEEISLEATGIIPHIITSITGGIPLAVMGIYSYITLCSTEEERTFRIACVAVTISAVPITANFASGYIYQQIGFINVCLLCTVVVTIGLLYGIFILKEPELKGDKKVTAKDNSIGFDNPAFENGEIVKKKLPKVQYNEKISKNNENNGKRTKMDLIREFFNPKLVVESVQVLTKKRTSNLRSILVIIIIVYFVKWGAFGDTMYAVIISKIKFNWISEIGIWVSYDLASTMIGTIVAIGILNKWLGVSDAMICIVSVIFTLLSKPIFMYAVYAVKPYLYFVGTTVDIFDGSRNVAIKSMISKSVGTDEIAKMFSLLGIVDSAQKIIYPTIYSKLYEHTKDLFVGSVFVLSEFFLLISFGLYIILYIKWKKNMKNTKNAKSEKLQNEQIVGIDNLAAELAVF